MCLSYSHLEFVPKRLAMKIYRVCGGKAPRVLNFDTGWASGQLHVTASFGKGEINPSYSLIRMLCEWTWSDCGEDTKEQWVPRTEPIPPCNKHTENN